MPDAAPRPGPFTPQTTAAALEDLRARLRATRWPDTPGDAGWSLGTDLAYLRELVAYWADGFDWPAQEAALARLPRFRVPLGGLGIHVVHVRAAAAAGPVLPLVLSHGRPATASAASASSTGSRSTSRPEKRFTCPERNKRGSGGLLADRLTRLWRARIDDRVLSSGRASMTGQITETEGQ